MSRLDRLNENRKNKKTIYFPVLMGVVLMLSLLIIVDFRVNDSLRINKITIIDTSIKEKKIFTLHALGYELVSLNLTYLNNDISKIKSNIKEIKDDIESKVLEAMSQE